MNEIMIGRYRCRVDYDVRFDAAALTTRGPRFRKVRGVNLSCMVSQSLLSDPTFHPFIERQFDDATAEAYRKFATVMERKIRRTYPR